MRSNSVHRHCMCKDILFEYVFLCSTTELSPIILIYLYQIGLEPTLDASTPHFRSLIRFHQTRRTVSCLQRIPIPPQVQYFISMNVCEKGRTRTDIGGFSVRCIDHLCYLPMLPLCFNIEVFLSPTPGVPSWRYL